MITCGQAKDQGDNKLRSRGEAEGERVAVEMAASGREGGKAATISEGVGGGAERVGGRGWLQLARRGDEYRDTGCRNTHKTERVRGGCAGH